MLKIGRCKLCDQEKPLLKRSHIIPLTFYKRVMGKEPFLQKASTNDLRNGNIKLPRLRSGEWESDVLCENCDNTILGKPEDYVRKVFYEKKLSERIKPLRKDSVITPEGLVWHEFENVDYVKLKRYALGLLWKSHISTLETFHEINLGSSEAAVKQLVFNEDAGTKDQFPVGLSTWGNGHVGNKLIFSPGQSKSLNGTKFIFPIGETIFTIYDSIQSVPEVFRQFVLSPERLTIFEIPSQIAADLLRNYSGH